MGFLDRLGRAWSGGSQPAGAGSAGSDPAPSAGPSSSGPGFADPGSAGSGPGHCGVVSGTDGDAGWRLVPPVQRLATGIQPTAQGSGFADSLATWRSPRLIGELAHQVSEQAPAGRVTGLIDPAPSAAHPGPGSVAVQLEQVGPGSASPAPAPAAVQRDGSGPVGNAHGAGATLPPARLADAGWTRSVRSWIGSFGAASEPDRRSSRTGGSAPVQRDVDPSAVGPSSTGSGAGSSWSWAGSNNGNASAGAGSTTAAGAEGMPFDGEPAVSPSAPTPEAAAPPADPTPDAAASRATTPGGTELPATTVQRSSSAPVLGEQSHARSPDRRRIHRAAVRRRSRDTSSVVIAVAARAPGRIDVVGPIAGPGAAAGGAAPAAPGRPAASDGPPAGRRPARAPAPGRTGRAVADRAATGHRRRGPARAAAPAGPGGPAGADPARRRGDPAPDGLARASRLTRPHPPSSNGPNHPWMSRPPAASRLRRQRPAARQHRCCATDREPRSRRRWPSRGRAGPGRTAVRQPAVRYGTTRSRGGVRWRASPARSGRAALRPTTCADPTQGH